MKKILLPLLAIQLFISCQKQISTDKTSEEIAGAAASKQAKFTVCHYDAVTGISKTIEVTQNALAGHLAHGDLQGSCSSVLTTICDQDWMIKNLDVDHYRNGDPIPQVTDLTAWHELTTGAWCYYENNTANGTVYGKLYNWYAVNDPRGLAPSGLACSNSFGIGYIKQLSRL
jgi:Fibrobacter succinogenes major domain (Fib_succ_major)